MSIPDPVAGQDERHRIVSMHRITWWIEPGKPGHVAKIACGTPRDWMCHTCDDACAHETFTNGWRHEECLAAADIEKDPDVYFVGADETIVRSGPIDIWLDESDEWVWCYGGQVAAESVASRLDSVQVGIIEVNERTDDIGRRLDVIDAEQARLSDPGETLLS